MSRYSKLLATIPGIVGMVLLALGVVTEAQEVQITAGLSALLSALVVYLAPPNRLPAIVLLVACGLTLAACTVPGEDPALAERRALTTACGTYVSTGQTLAADIRLGLIKRAGRDRIRVANQIIGPICGNEQMVLDPGAALALVEVQLAAMVAAASAEKAR